VPIIRTMELLGANSPCQMMLKRWRRELGHLQVESSVETWLQALFASVTPRSTPKTDSTPRSSTPTPESKVEHATALRLQAALLYHGYSSL
jgi:hypothetical protein